MENFLCGRMPLAYHCDQAQETDDQLGSGHVTATDRDAKI